MGKALADALAKLDVLGSSADTLESFSLGKNKNQEEDRKRTLRDKMREEKNIALCQKLEQAENELQSHEMICVQRLELIETLESRHRLEVETLSSARDYKLVEMKGTHSDQLLQVETSHSERIGLLEAQHELEFSTWRRIAADAVAKSESETSEKMHECSLELRDLSAKHALAILQAEHRFSLELESKENSRAEEIMNMKFRFNEETAALKQKEMIAEASARDQITRYMDAEVQWEASREKCTKELAERHEREIKLIKAQVKAEHIVKQTEVDRKNNDANALILQKVSDMHSDEVKRFEIEIGGYLSDLKVRIIESEKISRAP